MHICSVYIKYTTDPPRWKIFLGLLFSLEGLIFMWSIIHSLLHGRWFAAGKYAKFCSGVADRIKVQNFCQKISANLPRQRLFLTHRSGHFLTPDIMNRITIL